MVNKRIIYWSVQISGWLTYVVLAGIMSRLSGNALTTSLIATLSAVFIIGVVTSHLYRNVAIKFGWLTLGIYKLLPRVFFGAIIFSILFGLQYIAVLAIIDINQLDFSLANIFQHLTNWALLLFMWSLFYFAFHFFNNFRQEEIKNLKWEATNKEMELSQLRAQLNPHFIFNSMNTIRALVDENPKKAKTNITKLAKTLRTTLLTGKKKTVFLNEELELVKDYLDLEQSRFEERLNVDYTISESALNCVIPPMMLQTLVENGIKHGISKLPSGGSISLNASCDNKNLIIVIINDGVYTPPNSVNKGSTGFGISGTLKRLELLYEDSASFKIENKNNKVQTTLEIPQNTEA